MNTRVLLRLCKEIERKCESVFSSKNKRKTLSNLKEWESSIGEEESSALFELFKKVGASDSEIHRIQNDKDWLSYLEYLLHLGITINDITYEEDKEAFFENSEKAVKEWLHKWRNGKGVMGIFDFDGDTSRFHRMGKHPNEFIEEHVVFEGKSWKDIYDQAIEHAKELADDWKMDIVISGGDPDTSDMAHSYLKTIYYKGAEDEDEDDESEEEED